MAKSAQRPIPKAAAAAPNRATLKEIRHLFLELGIPPFPSVRQIRDTLSRLRRSNPRLPDALSSSEASFLLAIDRWSTCYFARRGRLPGERIEREDGETRWVFDLEDVLEFARERTGRK